MAETVRNERFFPWREACVYVGDKRVLNESEELYFRYIGFASVEMGEKSFDRVHVNGFLRLYPADVTDLRQGIPVGCNSALINDFMTINGSYNRDLMEKFIVFDDEVVIGAGAGSSSENSLDYPSGIYFRESELVGLCGRFGLSPCEIDSELVIDSGLLSASPEREVDLLSLVGGLSCLLARRKGEDFNQVGVHLSESFIDELFEVMRGLGVPVEGKSKFLYERLITEGVKLVKRRAG